MKKTLTRQLVCLLMAVPFLTGCDNKAPYYGDGIESEFNRIYSGKSARDHVSGSLLLTYSDSELAGKDVWFELMSETSARIKFYAIFPGEAETSVDGFTVTKTAAGYSISGGGTTARGTTFSASGTVGLTDGGYVMTLDLKDVAIPANTLSRKRTFTMMETKNEMVLLNNYGLMGMYYDLLLNFKWKVDMEYETVNGVEIVREDLFAPTGLETMLAPLLSNLLYLLLTDVTFHADGNITATYSPMPDDFNFMGLLTGFQDSDRGPKTQSPKNLITYYVDGGNAYIRPELVSILDLVMSNQSAGTNNGEGEEDKDEDDGGGSGFDLSMIFDLLEVYPSITRWFNEGIRFNLIERDPALPVLDYLENQTGQIEINGQTYETGVHYFFAGNYALYLDAEELKPLLEILPLILDLLDMDLSFELMPGMALDFGAIIDRMVYTSDINVGLYLD